MSVLDFNSNKEFMGVYVSKETKDKIQNMRGLNAERELLDQLLSEIKFDMKATIDGLDDDMVAYKARCLTYRDEVKKVHTEVLDKVDEFVSKDYLDKLKEVNKTINNITNEVNKEIKDTEDRLASLLSTIDKLESKMLKVNSYGFKNLVDTINDVRSMDSETTELLKFLVNNYNK